MRFLRSILITVYIFFPACLTAAPEQAKNRINQEIISDLAFISSVSFVTLGAIYAHHYFLESQDDKDKPLTPKLAAALGLSTVISGILQKPTKRLFNRLSLKLFPSFALDEKMRKLAYYQFEFSKKSTKLSKDLQNAGRKLIDRYAGFIESELDFIGLHSCEQALDDLLALPTEIKKIESSALAQIRELLSPYNSQTRSTIKNFIQQIYLASNRELTSTSTRITPVLLVGPPGTGKTFLARNIAKTLDLPMLEINLSNYAEKSERLYGFHNLWGNEYHRGVILETLMHGKGHKNVILFIDEIDKLFNGNSNNSDKENMLKSWLLNILEPSLLTSYSPIFDINLPIDNIIIILAANKDFSEEALRQRINRIYFEGFSRDNKEKIALQQLNSENIEINESVRRNLDRLLDIDQLAGVRVLKQVVNKYIVHLKSQEKFNELFDKWESRDFDIIDAYNKTQAL